MKKSTLCKSLIWGYQSDLDAKEYDELQKKIIQHEKETKAEDAGKLAESILHNFPEFQIMHQSFMRRRTDKISEGVNTIKVIVIIYLVASIIGAIAVLSQMK
jgi:hypothetical protein